MSLPIEPAVDEEPHQPSGFAWMLNFRELSCQWRFHSSVCFPMPGSALSDAKMQATLVFGSSFMSPSVVRFESTSCRKCRAFCLDSGLELEEITQLQSSTYETPGLVSFSTSAKVSAKRTGEQGEPDSVHRAPVNPRFCGPLVQPVFYPSDNVWVCHIYGRHLQHSLFSGCGEGRWESDYVRLGKRIRI